MQDACPWKDQSIGDNFMSSWWAWWKVINAANKSAIPSPSGILLVVLGLAWWGATLSPEDHMFEDGDGWTSAVWEVSKVLQCACNGKDQAVSGDKCISTLAHQLYADYILNQV